jgi:hypothetical protein
MTKRKSLFLYGTELWHFRPNTMLNNLLPLYVIFSKVWNICSLLLILIKGLGTAGSWISDFQKAVLIDGAGFVS